MCFYAKKRGWRKQTATVEPNLPAYFLTLFFHFDLFCTQFIIKKKVCNHVLIISLCLQLRPCDLCLMQHGLNLPTICQKSTKLRHFIIKI